MRHLLTVPLTALTALFALALSLGAFTAQAGEEKLDVPSLVPDEAAKGEADELGAGDMKSFRIKTDTDITALKEGDIYRSDGEKVLFKVTSIESKSSSGGAFMVQRTNGTMNPGKRFTRVSGSGPMSISSSQSLLDLYIEGGPFLHPIAFLGVLTIILGINGIWIYQRRRQIPEEFVAKAQKALKKGDIRKFGEYAANERGLFPAICRAMADRWSTSTVEDIQARAETVAGAQINRLRFPVKFLNLISTAAPLLGLLGTIVGMVIVFEAVAGATGAAKANALAAGIRVKLFSTAVALIVAIPSLFLYFLYNQRLSNLIASTELLTEQFMHQITVLKRRGVGAGAEESSDDAESDDEESDDEDSTAEASDESDDAAGDEAEEEAPAPKRVARGRA